MTAVDTRPVAAGLERRDRARPQDRHRARDRHPDRASPRDRRRDASRNPSFLFSNDGFRDLLLTPSLLLLVAIGSAIVIITRNVDLSVGSIVGLTAYLTGRMFIDIPGIPLIGVFIGGVLLGGFLGLINGALVAFARVPALVITLGTLYIYRGINVAWAGGDRINASDLPKEFRALGTDRILGIPILTIIAVVVLIAAAWYLRNLRSGRELYAIGSDPAAAHLYGLQVTRRVIGAFVVSRRPVGPGRRAVRRPLRHGQLGRRLRVGAAGDRRRRDRRRRDLGRRRHRLGCRDRRVPAAHDQPRPADPRHRRLLAARRGRRAHHRLDRARPRPRGPPASTTHRTTGGGPMTAATTDRRAARVYKLHARPAWRRFLLTRETAIIALLILVIVVALGHRPQLRQPADGHLPAARRRADPADRPADDAHHHHRGDRPLGREHRRALERDDRHPDQRRVAVRRSPRSTAILVGTLCGVVNGFLVTVVGLPSLAVTIGTLALFRGIAVGLLGTTAITDFPEFWTDLAKANIPGTPDPGDHDPVRRSSRSSSPCCCTSRPFGRSLYAIGLNKEAAQFSGIDVGRTKFILFVLSGAVSGFAGVYFTLLYSNARGDNAMGMELQVIAAVLLGGVSIFGGRGALHGVIAGVLLIGTLGSALRLAGVTSDIINVITGVLLIALGGLGKLPRLAAGTSLRSRRQEEGTSRDVTRRILTASPARNTRCTHTAHSCTKEGNNDVRNVSASGASRLAARRSPSASLARRRLLRFAAADGRARAADGGDANLSITMLPKNLGNPYFDTSTGGAEEATEEFGGTFEEVGPSEASPDLAGAVHPDRRPAGRGRARSSRRTTPRRSATRSTRRATPASRSSRSTPTPTRTAATCSSTRPPRRASRRSRST